MRLDRWIEELNTLPAEAPEWDHVSPFLQRLYQLAEAKHEERRVSRNRLGAVVDTLLQECGGELAYFGRADCSSWDVDGCPIPMVTPLVEQVEQFTATLRLHGRVRGQVAATLAEDQERLRTLMQLQEDVQRRYVLINQVLSGGGGVLPPDGTTSGGGTPGGDAAVAGEAGSGAASPAAATPAMSGVAAAGPAEPVPGPESGSVAEAVSGPGTGLAAAGVGLVVSASADMTDGVVGGRLDGLASAGTSGAAEVSPTSELEAGENTPPPVGYPDGAAEVVPPGLGGVAPLDEADEVVPCPPVEGPSEPAPQPAEAARGETIASLPREGSTEPELSEENAAVANPPFDEVRAGPGELLEAGQDPYAAPPGEGGGPAAAALASVPFPVAAAPPPVPSVPGASQGETENAPRQWRPPGGEQQESHVPVGIAAALGGAAAALGVARLWKQPDLAASPSAESASPLAPGPAAQPWEQVEEPTAGVDATPLPQPEAAPSAAPVPLDLVSAAEPLGAAAVEAPRLAEPELTEPADEPVARDVPEPEVAASALLTETTVLPPVTPTITVPELLAPAAAVSQPDPERAGEAAPCEPVLESAAVVETPVAGGTPARAPLGGGGTAREIPAALKALLEQDLAAGAPWETRVESRPSGPAAMLIQPPPAPVGEGALERHAASLGSVVPPASEPASGYAPWQTPGASVAPQGTAGADDAVQSVPAVPVGEEHGEGTAVRAAPGTAVVEEPWPASAGLPDPDAVWRRVSRERILDPHLLAVRHIVAQLGRREHHAWRTVGPVPVLERPKTAGSGESRPPDAAGGGGAPDSSANGLGFRTVQAGGAARESPASSAPGSADETEGGDGELDVAPSGSIAPQATASANGGPAGEVVRLSGETSPPAAPAADVPHGATLAGREPSPNPSELNPDRMAESEIVPAATGREAQAETVLPAEAPGEGVTYTASALPVAPDPKPAAKETASDGTLPVRPPPATFSVPRPAGLPVKTLGNWKRLAPIVGILAAIGVPLAAWNHSDRPMPSKRLADGSRLTLEYVSSGHVHRFRPQNGLRSWLGPRLPGNVLGDSDPSFATDGDWLTFWVNWSNRAGESGLVKLPDHIVWPGRVVAIDEHGFRYDNLAYQSSHVLSGVLPAYPRRKAQFVVELINADGVQARFNVAPPGKVRSGTWQPTPYPINERLNRLGITLTGIRTGLPWKEVQDHAIPILGETLARLDMQEVSRSDKEWVPSYTDRKWTIAEFAVTGDTATRDRWSLEGIGVSDPTGNNLSFKIGEEAVSSAIVSGGRMWAAFPGGLSPKEAAWKLRFRFWQPLAADGTLQMDDIKLPAAGATTSLREQSSGNGLSIKAVSLDGNSSRYKELKVNGEHPVLKVKVVAPPGETVPKVEFRVQDDQGVQIPGEPFRVPGASGEYIYVMSPRGNPESIRFACRAWRTRSVEFTARPEPGSGGSEAE